MKRKRDVPDPGLEGHKLVVSAWFSLTFVLECLISYICSWSIGWQLFEPEKSQVWLKYFGGSNEVRLTRLEVESLESALVSTGTSLHQIANDNRAPLFAESPFADFVMLKIPYVLLGFLCPLQYPPLALSCRLQTDTDFRSSNQPDVAGMM